MIVTEKEVSIPAPGHGADHLDHIRQALAFHFREDAAPVRFAVTQSNKTQYRCEVSTVSPPSYPIPSLFDFEKRPSENIERFNVALLVPTGIGAEIGGHAGDAAPVARLIAQQCDQLIIHPNVVNASDINEMPQNSLYVEGSMICRLLMGTIGLQPVRSNRVLVVIDNHSDELFVNAAINAVSAARSSFGFRSAGVVRLNPPIVLRSEYSSSGRAVGVVEGLSHLLESLRTARSDFDAVAVSSTVRVPKNYHQDYFDSDGAMVNPWGGVEAMLTHTMSEVLGAPSAHSPMLESRETANLDPGTVDPRMAAEAVSLTFLPCILKGLHRSPKIVRGAAMLQSGVLTARDISCLVIPDGCLGLPTIAALYHGIPVIAVRENKNLMKNDLSQLPWAEGQFLRVENYWEAAGILSALRAGIAPESVRRPLGATQSILRSPVETNRTSASP